MAQELPKISYLTLLDKYILLSFTFLALVGGQNTLAAVVKVDYGTFPIVDVSRYVIETIFLLIHVLLGALSLHYVSGVEKTGPIARGLSRQVTMPSNGNCHELGQELLDMTCSIHLTSQPIIC